MPKSATQQPVRVAHIAAEFIDALFADIERYIVEASNVDFTKLYKLDIRYGDPEIPATGYLPIPLAELLVDQGLLKQTEHDSEDGLTKNRVRLSLPISENLTKRQVNKQIRNIERFCSTHTAEYIDQHPRMLVRLRGERLHLSDEINDDDVKSGRYASYDRGLDICGFQISAAHVIPLLEDIHSQFIYAGVVVAERDPGLAAQASDTKWDLPGGAAGINYTYQRAARTETIEEFGASKPIVDRLVFVDYVQTNRLRGSVKLDGRDDKVINGIVREKIAVYIMPVKYDESAFVCNEKKPLYLSDRKGGEYTVMVPKNRAYPLVTMDELIPALQDGRHLKDGKRLSILCALLHHGLIQDSDARLAELKELISSNPLIVKKAVLKKRRKVARKAKSAAKAEPVRSKKQKIRKRKHKEHRQG